MQVQVQNFVVASLLLHADASTKKSCNFDVLCAAVGYFYGRGCVGILPRMLLLTINYFILLLHDKYLSKSNFVGQKLSMHLLAPSSEN